MYPPQVGEGVMESLKSSPTPEAVWRPDSQRPRLAAHSGAPARPPGFSVDLWPLAYLTHRPRPTRRRLAPASGAGECLCTSRGELELLFAREVYAELCTEDRADAGAGACLAPPDPRTGERD